MSFSTPTSAANASVTPPKTHSSGKWLANYDNPAKRVKTYDSPSPIIAHEDVAKFEVGDVPSPKPSGTVPAFDFSPIDTFPQEIAQTAQTTQPEAGSYLSDLIQDNFGSNAALESDNSLLESNKSRDPTAANNDISNPVLMSEIQTKGAGEPVTETTSDHSAPHRQGSTNASIASDITVPNTFDSLFKDNMEFTMPEDTMRAGMLAAALDLRNRNALEAMSPVNLSHLNSLEDTSTAVIPEKALPDRGANEESGVPGSVSAVLHDSDTLATSSENAPAKVVDHQPVTAEDIPSIPLANPDSMITSETDVVMSDLEPSIAVSAVPAESTDESEPKLAQESMPIDQVKSAPSVATPSTPVRKPRKTARTPQTAPRPTREPATPLSRSQRPIPMTESQAGKSSRKPRNKPMADVPETDTIQNANESPDPVVSTQQGRDEHQTTPTVFKTPAKAGRGASAQKKSSTKPSQTTDSDFEPQSASSRDVESDSKKLGTTEVDKSQISTPHGQELGSAKRSVRRSSQRITDIPVADPQPTPTKSSSKAPVEGSPSFDDNSAPFSSPAASRSSRPRQSDAPASIPKLQKEDIPNTDSSVSPLPARMDQHLQVLTNGRGKEESSDVPDPAVEQVMTPNKRIASPSIPKSTRKSTKKGLSTPSRAPAEVAPTAIASDEVEYQPAEATISSTRRTTRTRGNSQSTPIKPVASERVKPLKATPKRGKAEDEKVVEHFTVEPDNITETTSSRGRRTRKATSVEPLAVEASPASKKGRPVKAKDTNKPGTKRKRGDTSEAAATSDDADEPAQQAEPEAETTTQKSTRGRRKAAEPVKTTAPARASRKKAEPAPSEMVEEPVEVPAAPSKTRGSAKAAAAPRTSKRKAAAAIEEEKVEAASETAPVEPPSKKARGRKATAAKDPTPEPSPPPPATKATRAKGAKNAVVASPKTTRGTARTTTTRSTRSRK